MKINSDNVDQLVERLVSIEPLGSGDEPPPWFPNQPDAATLLELISGAAADLPLAYRDAYVTPLADAVPHLLRSSDDPAAVARHVESLVGAVYQHAGTSP